MQLLAEGTATKGNGIKGSLTLCGSRAEPSPSLSSCLWGKTLALPNEGSFFTALGINIVTVSRGRAEGIATGGGSLLTHPDSCPTDGVHPWSRSAAWSRHRPGLRRRRSNRVPSGPCGARTIGSPPSGSDKFYTSGLRLGWASGTDDVAEFTVRTAQTLWGDGITRISFDLTQQIYSPTNTARRTFLTDQRYRNSRRKT